MIPDRTRLLLFGLSVAAGLLLVVLLRLELRLHETRRAPAGAAEARPETREPAANPAVGADGAPPALRRQDDATPRIVDFPILEGGAIAERCAEALKLTPTERTTMERALSDILRELANHSRDNASIEDLGDSRFAIIVPASETLAARLESHLRESWQNALGPERFAVLTSSIRFREQLLAEARQFGRLEQLYVFDSSGGSLKIDLALASYRPSGESGSPAAKSRDAARSYLSHLAPVKVNGEVSLRTVETYLGPDLTRLLSSSQREALNRAQK